MSKRILHVVSNVAHYADPADPTGLWLSELTHAYHEFEKAGYEQQIVSPKGGRSPLEPRSLKWPNADATAKAWLNDNTRMALLENTASPDQIDAANVDAIYFTGGHAVMWDFPDATGLQRITREIFESGGVVAAVYLKRGDRWPFGDRSESTVCQGNGEAGRVLAVTLAIQ